MVSPGTLFYVLLYSNPGFVLSMFLNFLPKSRLLFLQSDLIKRKESNSPVQLNAKSLLPVS